MSGREKKNRLKHGTENNNAPNRTELFFEIKNVSRNTTLKGRERARKNREK